MTGLRPQLKNFATIFDELRISTDNELVRGSCGDTLHVATIVPNGFVERIIRCYHERPESSHQETNATTAKQLELYWPAIKRDLEIYIAVCTEFYNFKNLVVLSEQSCIHRM